MTRLQQCPGRPRIKDRAKTNAKTPNSKPQAKECI